MLRGTCLTKGTVRNLRFSRWNEIRDLQKNFSEDQ